MIIEFEVDENLFQNPYNFEFADDEFIDFVFNTRYNYETENIEYDVISGPMADGFVNIAMSLYKRIKCDSVKKIVKWNYRLPFNKHRQIVIKSQEICDTISIRRVVTLKGDVLYEQEKKS